ncbi:hypothetical protein N8I77_009114 [Diaporthe amygdali]|uniref:Ubiquitin-like protease family profile domain-containing protein n=1 Tax=Phomopsis amygdali TaxID=1214568 RepID=A0AAD9SAA8_PHOAM|nr:hypothetical protein N8I77_009114 [Diaporthe amygdali]
MVNKSSRLPRSLAQAGDSTVRLHKADKTDHSVGAGHVQEPRTTRVNGITSCGEPATTAAHSPTAASKNPPWDPIARYWSDKNSFPDYGKPERANMGRGFKESIGRFIYGDFLQGRASQAELPATTPKRVQESSVEHPAKRRRTEDDAGHDIHSTPSNSGLPERSVAASSGQRKGGHDAPDALSLRSSADQSANGKMVEEYRSAQQRGGSGHAPRSRRRKQGRRHSDGPVDDESGFRAQKMTSSGSFKPKNNLLHLQKPSDDPIQDDEDLEVTSGPVGRASVVNGRPNAKTAAGKVSYTTSRFFAGDSGSEDELSANPPTDGKDAADRKSAPVSQARAGRKRQIDTQIDEEPQITSLAKRRAQAPDRADMHRTTFGPQFGVNHGLLRVSKAVCEPSYVYPANECMHGDTRGASDKPCILVATTDGDRHFEALDADTREPVPDLVWLTPKLSKISKIFHARHSMIVKISKSSNGTPPLETGAVLFLQFGNAHEAEAFVTRCCNPKNTINRVSMDIDALSKEMDRKIEQIVAFNEKKVGKAQDTDVQYLEHRESTSNRANSKALVRSVGLSPQHSRQVADKRSLRVQMKTDSPVLADGRARPKTFAQEPTSLTPEQVKQLREDFGDDSQPETQSQRILRNEQKWQTPSRVGMYEPEVRSQRSLRSTDPKPKSPSPDRWTANHRGWADNWRIDLVYERTVVGKSDVERLDEGQLLNDEIITFYLKYLHKRLEERDEQLAKKVYFFNSFFWEKLKPKRGAINYEGVQNWTAKVDLLSFDYIIVPINEHAHWYVAIICNAKELLSSHDTSSETDVPGSDKPQDQAHSVVEDDSAVATANDTMEQIGFNVSHISIEDESAESVSNYQREDVNAATTKKPKALKKGPGPRKYDPKATRVITLDSLGGAHSAVSTALKMYLQREIEAKKGLRVEAPATIGTSARDIPTQPNFTDCGVYLLGYMRQFMEDPDKFAKSILQRETRDWDVQAPALRNEIRELIFGLQKDYQENQEQKRRVRAQAKRQKSKPQGVTMPSELFSRSSGESPARESPAPPSTSAVDSRQVTPLLADKSHLRADIDQDVCPSHEEAHMPRPMAGDTSVNINNVSMIVNVDESMDGSKANGSSTAVASKPAESIEVVSDDETPELSVIRATPSARRTSQSASTQMATPANVYDEREFLAPLPSSSALSSPVKAAPSKTSMSRASFGVVKSPGNQGSVRNTFLRGSPMEVRSARKKGRVTKSEVIPSSSEEDVGGKGGKKKKKPTIDLTQVD